VPVRLSESLSNLLKNHAFSASRKLLALRQ